MCVLYHSTLIHKIDHVHFSGFIHLNQIGKCPKAEFIINPPPKLSAALRSLQHL